MTKTKKIRLTDPFGEYQLALAHYLNLEFFVSKSGTALLKRMYTKEEILEILGVEDENEIDSWEDEDYEKINGYWYEKLENKLTSIGMNRYTGSDTTIVNFMQDESGFDVGNYHFFPIYHVENTGDSFLVVDEVHETMYAQLCENLWIIPDELLKKYFIPYDQEIIQCALDSAKDYRQNYGMYANPTSPLMGYAVITNTFLKSIIRRGDFLIYEALELYKPSEILSTFDRKTEFKTTFNGKTYFIYDLTLTTQLDQPNLEQEDM